MKKTLADLLGVKPPDRSAAGTFVEGNQAAKKYTRDFVLDVLNDMWRIISTDANGNQPENPLVANEIKTLGTLLLMKDISKQRWSEWEKTFAKDETVSELLKKIKLIVEMRLIEAGRSMDIFVLKNHYRYTDRNEVDHKNDGGKFEAPEVTKFDPTQLSTATLEDIMKARVKANE